MEEKAARAYDLAALENWGPSTHINFPVKTTNISCAMRIALLELQQKNYAITPIQQLERYQEELEETKNMSRQEYVAHLRR